MFNSTQTQHDTHTVTWIEDGPIIRARFCEFEIRIHKLKHDGDALNDDASLVRLSPRRYRTTVEGIIANPQVPIRGSLMLAQEDAIRCALELPGRIEAKRTARRKELLGKLGTASDPDE